MLNSDIIELREKLKEFYSQRIQLELGLEIIHHDATYSESLITLIQQEEALIKRSNINNQLSVKIDDQLKLENHKYFANSTLENLRKWREYKRKIEIERLQLNNSFDNSHIKALSDDNTFNILELENKRIEEDYNKNWLYYEGFHLEEAFKFQAEKFESDWNHQEHKFKEEFNTQKQELFDIKNDFLQPTNQSKSNFTTFPSLDSHKISKSQNVNEKHENRYFTALNSLQNQKRIASLWMERQKLRLYTQAREVNEERKLIGILIEKERLDIQRHSI